MNIGNNLANEIKEQRDGTGMVNIGETIQSNRTIFIKLMKPKLLILLKIAKTTNPLTGWALI